VRHRPPRRRGGSQSNRLTTAADFSEASLEDICVQIANAKDDVGLPAALQPKSLHIPTALMFEAARVLKSLGQNDTANNATNALRSMGLFQDGAKVSHYFDDDDAFFVRTDVEEHRPGLLPARRSHLRRRQRLRHEEPEVQVYERYIPNWTDFRGVYSNGGGA
jgi:hypothetical protein